MRVCISNLTKYPSLLLIYVVGDVPYNMYVKVIKRKLDSSESRPLDKGDITTSGRDLLKQTGFPIKEVTLIVEYIMYIKTKKK